jgi:hypothetical protein
MSTGWLVIPVWLGAAFAAILQLSKAEAGHQPRAKESAGAGVELLAEAGRGRRKGVTGSRPTEPVNSR